MRKYHKRYDIGSIIFIKSAGIRPLLLIFAPHVSEGYANMTAKSRKEIVRSSIKWTLSAGIAATLLYFSFRTVHWEEFVESIMECDFSLVLFSMAAGIAAFFLRAARWKELIKPLEPEIRFGEAFDGINVGNITNFIFPRAGEFIRCGVISSRRKITYDKVLGSVVLERSWDMLTLAAILLVFFSLRWKEFGDFVTEEMLMRVRAAIPFNLWWIAAATLAALGGITLLVIKTRDRNRISRKICSVSKGICQGFTSVLKMKDKWKFIIYTIAIWFIYWLMSYLTMLSLPDLNGLDATDAMFLMLVGSVAWVIPVPGAIGAFHLLVSMALTTIYGIGYNQGIAFATLSHEAQAITMIACGVVSLVRTTRAGVRLYGR